MDEKLPPDAALTAAVIRFTPFTLDVRAAELRKHGTRLRLPGQSFQVLRLLLEHPGEVVLREEIRDKLWPNGTIVEFDHSINAAIKQLRGALGDSAEEPRYIQTVGRQGYRFIGQLDAVEAAQLETPLAPKAAPADAAAEMVSHFRLLRKLGEGAMGKPLWLLLPFSPDWRWMLERNDSPWYPTARLFRQPRIGDWDSVIEALREALASQAATRHTRGDIAYL